MIPFGSDNSVSALRRNYFPGKQPTRLIVPFKLEDTAEILDATNPTDLLQRVRLCAKALGFDHCLFGVEVIQGNNVHQHEVLSAYPTQWQREYAAKAYIKTDPTISHCQTSNDPLIWTSELFAGASRELWESARGFGLAEGMSVPTHDSFGKSSSMLSVARDRPIEGVGEMGSTMAGVRLVASCAHIAATKLLLPELRKRGIEVASLTPMEHAVLQWYASGLDRNEIADKICRSEANVKYHLSNLFRKLGVKNRAHAVAKAMALGVI